MQILKWFGRKSNSLRWYVPNNQYYYILVILQDNGTKLNRVYSTPSPLSVNHTITLANYKSFLVTDIAHVTYLPKDVPRLTGPTTFVHVKIQVVQGQFVSPNEFHDLEFESEEKFCSRTLH